jgi:hypothetical protein
MRAASGDPHALVALRRGGDDEVRPVPVDILRVVLDSTTEQTRLDFDAARMMSALKLKSLADAGTVPVHSEKILSDRAPGDLDLLDRLLAYRAANSTRSVHLRTMAEAWTTSNPPEMRMARVGDKLLQIVMEIE